jgi:hypothetical protein
VSYKKGKSVQEKHSSLGLYQWLLLWLLNRAIVDENVDFPLLVLHIALLSL